MTTISIFEALANKGYSSWTAKLVYYEMAERVSLGEDPEVVLAEEELSADYIDDIVEAAHEF